MANYRPDERSSERRLHGAGLPVFDSDDSASDGSSIILRRTARTRGLTQKAQEQKINRMKCAQTAAKSVVTRKENKLKELMSDAENVHVVKNELAELEGLFRTLRSTHLDYCQELKTEDERKRERDKFAVKETSALELRQEVLQWIAKAEQELTEKLESYSTTSRESKSSRRSSVSRASRSSAASAKARERVRLAEMLVEKSMIKKRQLIQEAELDIEIAKAQAREQVYSQIEDEETQEDIVTSHPTVGIQQSTPVTTQATPLVLEGLQGLSTILLKTPPNESARCSSKHALVKDNKPTQDHPNEAQGTDKVQRSDRSQRGVSAKENEQPNHEESTNREAKYNDHNETSSVNHNEASSQGKTITQRNDNGRSEASTQGHGRHLNEGSTNRNVKQNVNDGTLVNHNDVTQPEAVTQNNGQSQSKTTTDNATEIEHELLNTSRELVEKVSEASNVVITKESSERSKESKENERYLLDEYGKVKESKESRDNGQYLLDEYGKVKESKESRDNGQYLLDEYGKVKESKESRDNGLYLLDEYCKGRTENTERSESVNLCSQNDYCTKSQTHEFEHSTADKETLVRPHGQHKPRMKVAMQGEVVDSTYFLQQHREMVASQQQLAAAMALPKPRIPTFAGDVTEYKAFIIAFDSRVAARTVDNADRLYYLQQQLQGEPRELISGCLYLDPDEGYSQARKLLDKEYGNPYKISVAYTSKILKWPAVKYDDGAALKRFSLFLITCRNAMKNISYLEVLNHAPNMQTVIQKLPPYLQAKWRDHVLNIKKAQRLPKFSDIVEFVERAAEASNDPVFSKEALYKVEDRTKSSKPQSDTKGKPTHFKQKTGSFAASVNEPAKSQDRAGSSKETPAKQCLLCNKPHDLDNCRNFNAKSLEERKKFVAEKNLCFACFGVNHRSKACKNKKTCSKCGKPHPTSMHVEDFKTIKDTSSSQVNEQDKVNNGRAGIKQQLPTLSNESSIVLHAILPVKVKQRDNPNVVTTYAFYDNGSSGCFITEKLVKQLNASATTTKLQLTTMHGQSHVDCFALKNLMVTDLSDNHVIELPKTYSREQIPVEKNQIPTSRVVSRIKELHSIAKRIPDLHEDIEVGLLIGSNCPHALAPLEVIPNTTDGPFALRLRHGWTVSGPLKVSSDGATVRTSSNCANVRDVETVKEVVTPEAVLHMFEMDFNDHKVCNSPDELHFSQEDLKFLEKVKQGIRRVDGHFEIPLPFRKLQVVMPNNRDQAVKRAEWQRKKMLKNHKYREDYVSFVNDIISKGYAERAPVETTKEAMGQLWYVPHHAVYHPRKPDKIRVVFDCSAKYQGVSLNSELLQGPDMTNSLVGVLTRFRQKPVAFTGDVESMFYQVKVPPEQRDYIRFVWWPNGDLNAPLEDYRMTVHLFGAVSSPSCCNYALKTAANEADEAYGTEVADTMKHNFYVDDCLQSVETTDEAKDLIGGLREACASKGFHLTKFAANSREVIQSIPEEERSKDLQTLDLNRDKLPMERTLGVQWCIESDTFGFRITLDDKPFTRRGLLSLISSIYDPLGFIAPLTLNAKRILQDLCREKSLGWDDEPPEHYRKRWIKWRSQLPALQSLHIDRCMKPPQFGKVVSQEIHTFSDASSTGYGAVAYLRLQDNYGNIHCSFLAGKARLAPLKTVTIPRLELTAATLAVRLGEMLKKELSFIPDSITYHVDSTTVLRYILNEQKRFQVYVANRIQTIRDFSSPSQWRYVESKQNPADDASRGVDCPTFVEHQRWLKGPEFLSQEKKTWLAQPQLGNVPDDDPEVKKSATSCATVATSESLHTVQKLIEHFSDWTRLKKAVAVYLRVLNILQMKRLKRKQVEKGESVQDTARLDGPRERTGGPFNVQELQQAELAIVRFVQAQTFQHELHTLSKLEGNQNKDRTTKKRELKKNSSICHLDPFVSQGIIYVGGRLRKASLPEGTKHPAILPRKSHVTTLVIRHTHEQQGHSGRGQVLAVLRQNYWVLRGNAAVRNVLTSCVSCRRRQGRPMVQKMADLPVHRTTPAPPFTYVGVDYFGPFVVKEGRKEMKRYGCLFTCLASRAIHIETACSLETDSFLLALRRFIARRGPVRSLYSDNGTNFVGANNELRQALKEMDQDKISSTLLHQEINWSFNPPCASHMGGIWERQVRTVRKVLAALMEEHAVRLDDESLRTLLCEVEAIINCRPITVVSSDANDPEPISPNMLLTTKTKVILPPPGVFQRNDIYMRKRWRRVQYLANLFWSRWKREYLANLQQRPKWTREQPNLVIGDIVLIKDETTPRNTWSMGRVISTEPDSQGTVRSVTLKTATTELRRPVHKLILLVKGESSQSQARRKDKTKT